MPADQHLECPCSGIMFKKPIWYILDSEEHYSVMNYCLRVLNIIKIDSLSLKTDLRFNKNPEAQWLSLSLKLGLRNPVQFKRASQWLWRESAEKYLSQWDLLDWQCVFNFEPWSFETLYLLYIFICLGGGKMRKGQNDLWSSITKLGCCWENW